MRCNERRVIPFVAIFLIIIIVLHLKMPLDEDKFENDFKDFDTEEFFVEKRTQLVPIDSWVKNAEQPTIQISTVGRFIPPNDGKLPINRSDLIHVTVYRRLGTSWTRERDICQSLPIMTVESRKSPIGPLPLYRMSEDSHESEVRFDGKILFDRIWDDVSDALYKVLASDRGIFLLDIGVDCGGYTYMAAQMGHRVIAVESNVDRIKELCKSTETSNLASLLTIMHLNITDKSSDWVKSVTADQNINLDSEIVCSGRKNYSFHLENVVELVHIRKYTKFVVRFDTLVEAVAKLLICGEEFFLHFDVEAVILPWSEVNDKRRVMEFFQRFRMTPFSADGFLTHLESRDFEYWPMTVMWRKDTDSW